MKRNINLFKLLCVFFQPPPPLFLALNLDIFAFWELSKKISWIRCLHLIGIHDTSLKIAVEDTEEVEHLILFWHLGFFLPPFPHAPVEHFILLTSGLSFTISCYCLFCSGLPTMIFKFLFCFLYNSLHHITIYNCLLLCYATCSVITPSVKHGHLIFRCQFLSPSLGSLSYVVF